MDKFKQCQGELSSDSFSQDPEGNLDKTLEKISSENNIDENGNEEKFDSKENREIGSDIQILEDVENRLQLENEEELRELKKKEKRAAIEKELIDQRFKRLTHLLTKSQFYSEYLVKKISCSEKEVEENGRKAKRMKRDPAEKENKGIVNFYGSKMHTPDEEPDFPNVKENEINFMIKDTQPKLLEFGILRPYQLEGYAWLKTLFENGVNGILADEMGLGKTIQVIALFCYFIMKGITGPFLVVAPLSTLPNWISEFKRFAPKIPTILYHGNEKERKKKRDLITKKIKIPEFNCKTCPIVITSYEVVIRDTTALKKYFWRYLAVDEGHRLKNHKCLLVKCLNSLSSTNRVILTGTPLQNNLSELWALLNFLLPDIFDNLDVFESWFEISDMMEEGSEQRIVQQEKEKQILSTLHKILNPFLLRRIKTDVDLQIPSKKELIVYTPMTQLQLDLYKAALVKDFSAFGVPVKKTIESDVEITEGRPKRKRKMRKDLFLLLKDDSDSDEDFDRFLDEAAEKEKNINNMVKIIKNSEDNFNIRNIMMLCRKVVNHPYLLQYPLTSEGEYKIDEELIKSCGKLQVLDQILGELKKRNHKVLIFSQMTKLLNIIEDYIYLRPQYKYKRLDGGVKLENRQVDIDEFNNSNDYFIYLLSTRAGGLGINLTSADTVIIYDSDWNPQQDLQAQDRCHRIGQTRPVLILRLVTASTVDQEMVERATAKRKLEKMVMKKGAFKSFQKVVDELVDPEELLKLLQSRDSNRIYRASTGSGIFTSDELDQLLDRSDLTMDESNSVMKEVKGIFKTITNVIK